MKFVVAALLLIQLALGDLGLKSDGSLDMPALEATYKEGELEAVKNALESYLKNRGEKATRDERVFAYKYLGVIHAADPDSRTRAESFFNQLFQLTPHIELAGMFVSKNIQALFDEVKRDFERNTEYKSRFDALGHPIASPEPATKGDSVKAAPQAEASSSRPNRKWIWWTAGGFVAAAAAGTANFLAVDGDDALDPQNFNGDFR
jgi:hypothetical protein